MNSCTLIVLLDNKWAHTCTVVFLNNGRRCAAGWEASPAQYPAPRPICFQIVACKCLEGIWASIRLQTRDWHIREQNHSIVLFFLSLGDTGIKRQGPWRPRTETFPTEEDQNITEHVAWIRRVRTALSNVLAPRWRQTWTGNVIVKAESTIALDWRFKHIYYLEAGRVGYFLKDILYFY